MTLAAAELHVTHGAISRQIRKLEDHLGIKLFHRLTRQIILTEEGAVNSTLRLPAFWVI
ncbi:MULTISPECIES: LysR family transcriptional regulator [unclassified Enterobacter]|uniref:LysR family transcriptional regulator n=1 Tax=unclassified Enterobacter TaxID=2608935 RepID=UPI001EEF5FBE|nr:MULTISPECIES: LysR family transcriptional regulator [unclassified Enterobacter]MEA3564117.1 LysR family transcriptional regulator [Enterobacter sp. GM-22]MEA3597792.1 LysR family transcriptional regulator [Enterobacter sp. GM-31]